MSLRGARRDLKDQEGKRPIDLIDELIEDEGTKRKVLSILGPPGALDFLML